VEVRIGPPESLLTLNGQNIPFVNNVKYLGIIFNRKITWRLDIKTIETKAFRIKTYSLFKDRLCGLVVRVLGCRSGGPGSIPGTTKKKRVVGVERGPLSLVTTTDELPDRKVAAPV
jgi:hypothetical protein